MPQFSSQVGRYKLRYVDGEGSHPDILARPPADAAIRETFDLHGVHANFCFDLTVTDTERSRVAHFSGTLYTCHNIPPVQTVIVEETRRLWLSVSGQIRVYDLDSFTQISEHDKFPAFDWVRTDRSVILISETDLICWDLLGAQRWLFFVDPPHEVTVRNGWIYVKDEVCRDPPPRLVKFREDTGPPGPQEIEAWDGVAP